MGKTPVARMGWFQRRIARLNTGQGRFGAATAAGPEVLRWPGTSALPPVRIFVGAGPAQFRAVRVLIWSISALRDPARGCEIWLLSDLAGIPRAGWATGHAGYRAAVPHYAGGQGRAIYCDADVVFRGDPARLFDADMGGAAVLQSPQAGALALLDCAALAAPWPIAALRAGRSPAPVATAPLPPDWAESAGVLTPAERPWRQPLHAGRGADSPPGAAWLAQEAAADAAGFLPFTAQAPSREFAVLVGLYRQMHSDGAFPGDRLKHHLAPIRELAALTGARTLLDYGAGKAQGYQRLPGAAADSPWRAAAAWPGIEVRCFDPGVPDFADPGTEPVDGVISTDVVEHLSPWDVAWVLDAMFARARGFVFVVAACYPAITRLPDGRNAHTALQSHDWWRDQMALAARRHPGRRWRLGCDDRGIWGKRTRFYGDGAP